MKYGVSFRADMRVPGQLESIDAIDFVTSECTREQRTRFTVGNFVFFYFVTDEAGFKVASLGALVLDYPAAYLGPI